MSLDAVPLGKPYRIVGLRFGGCSPHRLMERGFVEGMEVQVLHRAPLGDPLQLRLGDYELSLRSSDAALIDVTAI